MISLQHDLDSCQLAQNDAALVDSMRRKLDQTSFDQNCTDHQPARDREWIKYIIRYT